MRTGTDVASLWNAFTGIWESKDFRRYLHRRGFRSTYDWPFFRRAFLECWAEPGFHRFWRVWNPSLSFLVFKLYRLIGGNRGEPLTKIVAFVASGLAHGLLVLPFLGWSYTIPVVFTCFGLLAGLGEWMSRLLRQAGWHPLVNAMMNIALVLGCFSVGFRLDGVMRGY
jgi:D-alanyl-lipoteichoic acid acyltransferase DltB (MBOAT superfamily)